MRATRLRRWMVVALAIFAGATGASAQAAGTNLLLNGDFEGTGSGSLTGWKGEREPVARRRRRRRFRGA